jgi:hypothetical protein
MLSLVEILALIAIAATAWFLWTSLRARESGNTAIRAACEVDGYFFLDDTVGLRSVKPVRDEDGHLALERVFTFAYSDTGHNRRMGSITLVGNDVVAVDLGAGPAGSERAPH